MWDFFKTVWKDFSAVLNPVSLILFLLLIWAKVESYFMRIRVGKVLNAKDATISELTKRNIDSIEGYSRLTNLLEMLVEKLRK